MALTGVNLNLRSLLDVIIWQGAASDVLSPEVLTLKGTVSQDF